MIRVLRRKSVKTATQDHWADFVAACTGMGISWGLLERAKSHVQVAKQDIAPEFLEALSNLPPETIALSMNQMANSQNNWDDFLAATKIAYWSRVLN